MFTGIVQSIGALRARETRGGDLHVRIGAPLLEERCLALGASVAVAGVCLTVVERFADGFAADISRETLAVTTAALWQVGQALNLEPALRAGDALGGHWVSGHVDGRARLLERTSDARSQRLRWLAPPALARFLAPKGSVTLDGVSLTINEALGGEFGVNLVPHTVTHTTLGSVAAGGEVNIEVDVVARYAVHALHQRGAVP